MTDTNTYSLQKLLLSALIILMLGLGASNTLDSASRQQLESSFSSAMKTFLLVRGINAAISVLQGTEIAIEPGGVGVILTPGQVLDPANDMIERFSWVVFAAGTSLGAQLILLDFGASSPSKILLLMAGAILLLSMWTRILDNLGVKSVLIKLSLIVIFLRFLVPVVVLSNEAIYKGFLSATYTSSFEALEKVAKDTDEFQHNENASLTVESEQSLLGSIGRFFDQATKSINITARYKAFASKVTDASNEIVRLIAVYTFQTLVFPLLFLWLAVRLGGLVLRAKFWLNANS